MDFNLSEDILSLLVDAYPESIRIENIFGQLPVDCYRGGDSNIHRLLTPLEQNQDIASVRPLQSQPQQLQHNQQQQQQQEKTENKGSLLFELLKNNSSYNEVKTFLQKQPEAVQQQNEDGFLPLHMSLSRGTSENIVTLLLELFPEAAAREYYDGYLAIHGALRCKRYRKSERLIQLLLDAYPLATEKRNGDGELPLIFALWKSSDDIIKMVFEAYPKAVEFRVLNEFQEYELPLHVALRNNASDCTIKMLFNAHPMAAEIADEEGWLPLHFAVYYCASSEIILMLLDTYPKVAEMRDDRGDLPLHCLNWAVISTSVVEKLLEAYPGAARVKNNEGQTPLHCACNKKINKNSLISIQSLISVYPEGIDVEDNNGLLPSHYLTTYINHGHLPSHYFTTNLTRNIKKGHESNKFLLHMAIRNNFSNHLVTLLVRGYPQLCLKRDNHGKIPLHYACEGKTPNSIFYIMTLLNASAESLYVEDWQTRTPRQILANTTSRKDGNEMLPLHHLAAASDTLSVESLKLLVDVYPESITTADNHGLLPIHYACLNQAISLDVLTQFIKLNPEGIKLS